MGAGGHATPPVYIHNHIHFVGEMDVYQLARQLQSLQRVWNEWSILDIYGYNPGGLISSIVRYSGFVKLNRK